jgi:hypothetical protein
MNGAEQFFVSEWPYLLGGFAALVASLLGVYKLHASLAEKYRAEGRSEKEQTDLVKCVTELENDMDDVKTKLTAIQTEVGNHILTALGSLESWAGQLTERVGALEVGQGAVRERLTAIEKSIDDGNKKSSR